MNFWTCNSSASLSFCKHYRWWLSRTWGLSHQTLLFIGLNPSLASVSRDDPTLRRIRSFAKEWHYDRLLIINLFARISTSPAFLRRCNDPVGELNDHVIEISLLQWSCSSDWDLCLGWGVGGCWRDRDLNVLDVLQRYQHQRMIRFPSNLGPQSLGQTKGGHPRHPLYLPRQAQLRPFSWAEASLIRHP